MQLIQKFNKASLTQKILAVVAIPTLSYLIVSFLWISNNVTDIFRGNQMSEYNKITSALSAVTRELQVERGKSAVFLKGNGSIPIGIVAIQRGKTELVMENLIDASAQHISSDNTLKSTIEGLDFRKAIRKKVDENANTAEVIADYGSTIGKLITYMKSTAEKGSATIGTKIRSQVLLETARENAGQLRANMASILASDMPIEGDQFQLILKLKAGVDNNLQSQALDLSSHSFKQIEAFAHADHWRKVDSVFKTILTLANEGGYGEDSGEFFTTITKVVDDIGGVIVAEGDFIAEKIQEERSNALSSLTSVSIGIVINLSLIFVVLFLFTRKVRKSLSAVINNLGSSSTSIADASGNLTSTSEHLASGSQETAAALQETVSSMSEMNSMVARTLEKAKETTDRANSVANTIREGDGIVEDMVGSMDAIKDSNERLTEINKVINSISKQTNVINDIVFKTQLLAVNASIESAKAGVHGKGFAVVADEVSKLAQLSGDAAARISDLLDESNEKVHTIIDAVRTRVTRGSETTQKVKGVFSEIKDQMEDIRGQADDMSQASEEQNLGIEQVTTAVSEIDSASQDNSSEAQAVEKHAARLRKESNALKVVAHALTELVYTAGQQVKVDKVENSASEEEPVFDNVTPMMPVASAEESFDLADDDSFRPASND